MLDGMSVIVAAIGYVCVLFLIAWWGDTGGRRFIARGRPLIYSLSLAVYCTTWTYYGSVGLAPGPRVGFPPLFIGPILLLRFGPRVISPTPALPRAPNLTSGARF